MAQAVTDTRDFLEKAAAAIAEWFPELGGRAFAVSEVDPFDNKTNIPTLPVAVVALVRETYNHNWRGRTTEFDFITNFVVEFMLPPSRIQRANGSETPFWSFYDYKKIRDGLLSNFPKWEHGGGIEFVSMDQEADPLAVYISFSFNRHARWCADPEEDPKPVPVTFCLQPKPSEGVSNV